MEPALEPMPGARSGRSPRPQPAWRRVLLLVLALTLAVGTGDGHSATRRDYYFDTISSDRGLAQTTVRVLFQDRRGFIWIATEAGLHRFDGYSLDLYQHDPGRPDSLPVNAITAVADAPGKQLWVGSAGGDLVRFDPLRRRSSARISMPDMAIAALFTAADGDLWIGQGGSVYMLRPPFSHATELFSLPPAQPGSRAKTVFGFAQCPDGRVFGASTDGLLALAPHPGAGSILGAVGPVYSVLCDAQGRLFLTDASGLAEVARTSGDRRRIWPEDGDPPGVAIDLAMDHDDWLWIAVQDVGLVRVSADGRESSLVTPQAGVAHSLPETDVSALMIDRSGLLWVGSESHGAALFDPRGAAFQTIVNTSAKDPLAANNVRALYIDPHGVYWIGTQGAGLQRYDPGTDDFASFTAPLLQALGEPEDRDLIVYAIAPAAAGALWVGTNLGALHLDPASGRARKLPLTAADIGPLVVRSILLDSDGSLWLGTLGSGLLHYRDGVGVLRRFGTAEGLAAELAWALLRDRAGRLWAGTPSGLSLFDPIKQRFRSFHNRPGRADSLSGVSISDIHQSAAGELWIGTTNGLDRLLQIDAVGAHVQRYLHKDRVPDETAYCVLTAAGQAWVSGNLGITRVDPKSGQTRTFTMHDGLQGLEFNAGACATDPAGALVFGGVRGLSKVVPEGMGQRSFLPPTLITSFQFGSDPRQIPATLSAPPETPASTRVFRFAFVSLDYAAPARNQFQYRLGGFDQDWVDAGTAHSATYTNLDPGSYRFEVRGSNAAGIFNPDPAVFEFVVTPAWWMTVPARLAALLLGAVVLLCGILILHRRRVAARNHRAQLNERDSRLKLALWGSGDQFWDWDIVGNLLHRIGADQVSGGESEQSLDFKYWRDHLVHPDDVASVDRAAREHLQGTRDTFESEHRIRNADGEWMWVRSRGKIVERDEQGAALRLCGTAHDITAQRQAERERRIAAEVIRSMAEAVCVTDLDFHFVSVNVAFTRVLGYAEEEIVGQDAALLNGRQHSLDIYRQARETLQRSGHWRGEMWQRRKTGEEFLCWLETNEVWDAHGDRTHFVSVLTDITERKRIEQELRYLANYDALTGLPNRILLSERLNHAIHRARRNGTQVVVLFIDLDRFKQINDTMGHAIGDRVLKAAGRLLRASVRGTDTVARFGGDEFAVVLEDIQDLAEAERIAADVIKAFQTPLTLDVGQEMSISPSIGIAIYPDHGKLSDELLKFADTAMYQAKARGRNTSVLYTEDMAAHTRRQAAILNSLRGALARKELSLVFQPKLDLDSWHITGVEALLRWTSEDLGVVSPAVFIPLAEEAGLIPDIGKFVLSRACATLAHWRRHGIDDLSMAVNISSAQLIGNTLVQHLDAVLSEHGLSPHRLELELTEGLVMSDAKTSLATLDKLKALGVRLAIDDFGTGYSSLSYLKRLPLDTLKIDKEFIDDLTVDPNDEAITTTIITMAHSLGLNVVAEGVETSEQLAYLREKDCDEIQGNWFSPALPAPRCLEFLCHHDPAARPLSPLAGSGL